MNLNAVVVLEHVLDHRDSGRDEANGAVKKNKL